MRRTALELLRCPECAGCLTLRAYYETSEVEEGLLTCDLCDRRFPIINAIPRLLPDVHIHVVGRYHADFFRRWKIDPDLIISRSSKTDIGELMLKYGGGGHENAGTCQVDNDDAERVLGELIEQITADG